MVNIMVQKETKKNRDTLSLKMEPQELNYKIVEAYLPEKWEMPRKGKLLYSDEGLLDVFKILVFNLGVKKSLDTISYNLIEQYIRESESNLEGEEE